MEKSKLHPQITTYVINNLNAWRYKFRVSQHLPIHSTLRKAILSQDRIRWKQFVEGFWSKYWRECQTEHLNNINSPSSSLLLLSKVQHHVWKITWDMWSHRNEYLHGDKASIPNVEQTLIDTEVTNEWNIGILTLARRHHHLFRTSLEVILQKSYHNKRTWLASVWTAREIHDANHLTNNPTHTDNTIRLRHEQWKRRYQHQD